MKKIFSVFVLSLTLGTSSLCATESTKIQFAQDIAASHSLTQAEMAFLFDSSDVNVIALSEEEMALTQGEGFFATLAASFAVSAGIGAVKWGFCRLTGGKGCRFTASGKAPF